MKKIFLFVLFTFTASFQLLAAPVEFQNIPEIMDKFASAKLYVKKSPTLGRLPKKEEIGLDFPTYVSDGKGGYLLETRNLITEHIIIASMPEPIVGNVYNQWLIPKDVWKETYGDLPNSTKFQPYKRIKPIKAIKIDSEILTLLGSKNGETAIIKVSWDPQGMKVYKEGYLADYEYGIAPQEMRENYERSTASS